LPQHASASLCFKDQRARWNLFDGNEIRVWTRVGLFVGSPPCDTGDLKAEADVSVTAPPSGGRVCGRPVKLQDDGDVAEALLCLTNERIDPRPAASVLAGNSGAAPFTVQLDGSPSIVPDGVATWHWDFGDGQTAVTGPRINHQYTQPGAYPVTLRITDTNGLTRSAAVVLATVHPQPTGPTAVLDGPSSISVGSATFDASASTPASGQGGAIFEYRWDFGDGTQATTRPPQSTFTHQYTRAGIYTVEMTVFTANGKTATDSLPLTVLPSPQIGGTAIDASRLVGGQPQGNGPTAMIQAPATAEEGEPVTFDASGSQPGSGADGVIVSYNWDFGDGNARTAVNDAPLTHTYEDDDD
jgi:PKD repeat protein